MDPNAQRRKGARNPGADAYWQRRFFTLVAGLGVIGLLAWACSGVASGGKSSHNSSGGRSAAAYASTAGTPSPSAPATSAPASPSLSASPSPSASPSTPATRKAAAAASGKAHPAKAAGVPVACPAADLVLTLTASQASYGPKVMPTFQVDVVSTGTANCLLDTGAGALKLVVAHGSAVAYNSAACLNGAKRHVTTLRRGVPVVTSMGWNRQQTTADCSSPVTAATGRTYTAVVQDGGAQSPLVSFRLRAAPATKTSSATKSSATSR